MKPINRRLPRSLLPLLLLAAWTSRVEAQQPAPPAPVESAAEEELAVLRARIERLEAALAAQSAANATSGDDERVQELEDRVEELEAQVQETSDALTTRMDRSTRVFGYAASNLQLRDGGDLDFRGFRVNMMLDARLSSVLRFFAEIEFEDGAFIGASESDSGLVEVERGFMEVAFDPAIGVRAGILLASFGRFNLDHQDWRFPFSDRPIVYDRIFPSTYADVGVELFGTLANTDDVSFSYRVGMVNGLRDRMGRLRGGAVDFSGGLRASRPLFHDDNNDAKSVVGRLGLTLGEHIDIGASGYWGIFPDNGDTENTDAAVSMGGLDIWMQWRDFTMRAEGAFGHVGNHTVSFEGQDDTGAAITVSARTPEWMSGAYLELEGRFMPEDWHRSALGHFGQPGEARFFVAGRVDYARIDLRDAMVDQTVLDELRFSASIGYRPIIESAIRLEMAYGLGRGLALPDTWMARLSFALGY